MAHDLRRLRWNALLLLITIISLSPALMAQQAPYQLPIGTRSTCDAQVNAAISGLDGGPSFTVQLLGPATFETIGNSGPDIRPYSTDLLPRVLSHGGGGGPVGGVTLSLDAARVPPVSHVTSNVTGGAFPATGTLQFFATVVVDAHPGVIYQSTTPIIIQDPNLNSWPHNGDVYTQVGTTDFERTDKPGTVEFTLSGASVTVTARIPAPYQLPIGRQSTCNTTTTATISGQLQDVVQFSGPAIFETISNSDPGVGLSSSDLQPRGISNAGSGPTIGGLTLTQDQSRPVDNSAITANTAGSAFPATGTLRFHAIIVAAANPGVQYRTIAPIVLQDPNLNNWPNNGDVYSQVGTADFERVDAPGTVALTLSGAAVSVTSQADAPYQLPIGTRSTCNAQVSANLHGQIDGPVQVNGSATFETVSNNDPADGRVATQLQPRIIRHSGSGPTIGNVTLSLDDSRPVDNSTVESNQVSGAFPATGTLRFHALVTSDAQPGVTYRSIQPIVIQDGGLTHWPHASDIYTQVGSTDFERVDQPGPVALTLDGASVTVTSADTYVQPVGTLGTCDASVTATLTGEIADNVSLAGVATFQTVASSSETEPLQWTELQPYDLNHPGQGPVVGVITLTLDATRPVPNSRIEAVQAGALFPARSTLQFYATATSAAHPGVIYHSASPIIIRNDNLTSWPHNGTVYLQVGTTDFTADGGATTAFTLQQAVVTVTAR